MPKSKKAKVGAHERGNARALAPPLPRGESTLCVLPPLGWLPGGGALC